MTTRLLYCEHCDDETNHVVYNRKGVQRDYDLIKCKVCKVRTRIDDE